MYNKNNDIGWKTKSNVGGGNSGEGGSYDDTLIKNQIASLNTKINNVSSELDNLENDCNDNIKKEIEEINEEINNINLELNNLENYNDAEIREKINQLQNQVNNISLELEQKANINDIPTKTSQLTNDNKYATETYVQNQIANAQLGGGEGNDIDLSDYATKEELKDKADSEHLHDEYMTEENVQELINDAQLSGGEVDLSDYATKEYVEEQIDAIDIPEVDLSDYATESYVDDAIANIQPSGGSSESNYWKGKKMVVNGDSIPFGSVLTNAKNAFPYKVASMLGMTIVNYAIGGSTIAKQKNSYDECYTSKTEWDNAVTSGSLDTSKKYLVNTEDGTTRPYRIYTYSSGSWKKGDSDSTSAKRTPVCDRVREMDTDADVVMIAAGTNDFYYNLIEFGNFETSKYRALNANAVATASEVAVIAEESEYDMSVNLAEPDKITINEQKAINSAANSYALINGADYYTVDVPITGKDGYKIYIPFGRSTCFMSSSTALITKVNISKESVPYTYRIPIGTTLIRVSVKYGELPVENFAVYTEPLRVLSDIYNLSDNLASSATLHDNTTIYSSQTEYKIIDDPSGEYFTHVKVPVVGGKKIYIPKGRAVWELDSSGTAIKRTNVATHDYYPYELQLSSTTAYISVAAKYEEISTADFGIYTEKGIIIKPGFDTNTNLINNESVELKENNKLDSSNYELTSDEAYYTYIDIPITGGREIYAPYGEIAWFLNADGDSISSTDLSTVDPQYICESPDDAAYVSISVKVSDVSSSDFGVYMSVGDEGGDTNEPDTPSVPTVNETFCDALHYMCRYLLQTYKDKDIILCTPIKRVQTDTWDCVYPEDTNAEGKTLKDFRDAIIEACEYYSIPYIDLYTLSGLNPHIDPSMFADTNKAVHPTVAGHERMASVVTAFLKSLRN